MNATKSMQQMQLTSTAKTQGLKRSLHQLRLWFTDGLAARRFGRWSI